MLALISVSGHVIFPDVPEFMTDEEIFARIERRRPSHFMRAHWEVFRGRDWAPGNYALNSWEVWLTARMRKVITEICDKHEIAFRNFVLDLGPFPRPEPPAPYRDPYASIEWEEPNG